MKRKKEKEKAAAAKKASAGSSRRPPQGTVQQSGGTAQARPSSNMQATVPTSSTTPAITSTSAAKIDLIHTLADHMTLVRITFIWLVTCFRVRISKMYSIISRARSVVSNRSTQNPYFLIIEGGVGIFMIDVWWRQYDTHFGHNLSALSRL